MLWTIRGLARNTIWFGATHQGQWRAIVECLRGKEDLNSRPVRRVLDAQNLDLNLVRLVSPPLGCPGGRRVCTLGNDA